MNAVRLILLPGICWGMLAGTSACRRDSSPPQPSSQLQKVAQPQPVPADLQQDLAKEQKALDEYRARIAKLNEEILRIEKAISQPEQPKALLERDSVAPNRAIGKMPEITPEWIKIERGMKADELIQIERGTRADQWLRRDAPRIKPPVPDLWNPRLRLRPGADGRD